MDKFELLQKTFGGSGYDIACAQSLGPITYEVQSRGPRWEASEFNPHFRDNLYFVYLCNLIYYNLLDYQDQ